ncbi:MAG: MCE family protein, partial [Deltaproteobacteria bacterium]|nr:MCE family protein [Deltaproteobacteria bacterium]
MFDMRKQLRWSKLKVGMVITLANLVLLVAIFFAGGIEKIFSPKMDLRIQFQDVRGLRKGAPVWIFGTEAGSVREIHLDRTLGAVATISLKKSVQGFIKKDARASILTMGLLGDKYIEISTGSPEAEPIGRGEMIKGSVAVEISEVME